MLQGREWHPKTYNDAQMNLTPSFFLVPLMVLSFAFQANLLSNKMLKNALPEWQRLPLFPRRRSVTNPASSFFLVPFFFWKKWHKKKIRQQVSAFQNISNGKLNKISLTLESFSTCSESLSFFNSQEIS